MILIIADIYDLHADKVEESLKKDNISYFRLNLDYASLIKTRIIFHFNSWIIQKEDRSVNSIFFSCVWCRRAFVELSLEEREKIEADVGLKIWRSEWNVTLLGLYTSIRKIPWLNPLREAIRGENKYWQMELATDIGFFIPPTIISNSKKELIQFCREHNDVVFKLMSQDIYTFNDRKVKGFYTNRISERDLEKLFLVDGENPIVLQKYIEKQYEVRYTVVGEEHFVCRIDSQMSSIACNDWRRYDIANTPHTILNPPEKIKRKVSLLLNKMEICYGALDFIVTPKDEWYFLEINCMGQWLWIEDLTGLKISQSIARWLKTRELNQNQA